MGTLPSYEAARQKEKGSIDKLGTAFGDLLRDIGTANEMAKAKFDGDTALMHTARGSVSAMIGVGLETALDSVWDKAMDSGELWVGRILLKFGDDVKDKLKQLQGTRLSYFIENASKDLITGAAYNGIAYFSRPMLPSAEAPHLVYSTFINAVEAAGTKGLPSELQNKSVTKVQKQIEAQESYIHKRKDMDQYVDQNRDRDYINALIRLNDLKDVQSALPAPVPDTTLKWQSTIRKYIKYTNPVTLLGMDWMLDGVGTLLHNVGEVRRMRAAKGGLSGKKVYMPSEAPRGYQSKDRRDERPKGENTVYFGRGAVNVKKGVSDDLGKDI